MKKLLPLIIMIVSASACTKGLTGCETWATIDICEPKNGFTICQTNEPQTLLVCAGKLQDAKAGRVTIISENSSAVLTRHYIKKVE